MSQPCRLRSWTPVPNGGYRYTQLMPDGSRKRYRSFDKAPMVDELWQLRSGNNLPRASRQEVEEDISIGTCADFGCDPRYCTDGTFAAVEAVVSEKKRCGGCGFKS
jgi:hypothetical protein